MLATIRATTYREAAKEFFQSNPAFNACDIGEPGTPEKWRFSKSAEFATNPNRMTLTLIH